MTKTCVRTSDQIYPRLLLGTQSRKLLVVSLPAFVSLSGISVTTGTTFQALF